MKTLEPIQMAILRTYLTILFLFASLIVITLFLDAESYLSSDIKERVMQIGESGLKISLGAALGALSVLLSKSGKAD